MRIYGYQGKECYYSQPVSMSESKPRQPAAKVGFWPSPQDYNEAIQNPSASFSARSLQEAEPELDSHGLPRPISGGFASVYKLRAASENWAIRFFLRNVSGQNERYAGISSFLNTAALPCMVNFEYQPEGVRIGGSWYPLMKMEWIEGDTLEQYILRNVRDSEKMERLCEQFLQMECDLRKSGIAHGDLQHGNIIVTESGVLRLVDYDGLYLPTMTDQSTEKGHANYQHPRRQLDSSHPNIDNFSALVIYTSLVTLARTPNTVQQLEGCTDNLLFRCSDFLAPEQSQAFHLLENHADRKVRHLTKLLRSYISVQPSQVPSLQNLPESVPDNLPALSPLTRSHGAAEAVPAWWAGSVLASQCEVNEVSRDEDSEYNNDTGLLKDVVPGAPLQLFTAVPRPVRYNQKLHQVSPYARQVLIVTALFAVWSFTIWCLLITGTAFLAPLGLLLIPTVFAHGLSSQVWKVPRLHRRLVRKGVPVRATISEICPLKKDSHSPKVMIYYSFVWNSKTYSHYMVVSEQDRPLLAETDEVTVLCDPNDPSDSVIYDLSNYVVPD